MPIPNDITFTPFDQLPASQLNDLIENDKALAAGTAFDLPLGYQILKEVTLGTAGDTISATSIPFRNFYKVLVIAPGSGSTTLLLRFNNDTGANYGTRYSANGGADANTSGASSIILATAETSGKFAAIDVMNIPSHGKSISGQTTSFTTTSNAPTKWEFVGQWSNTAAITRIDAINDQAGDFTIGSKLYVLG